MALYDILANIFNTAGVNFISPVGHNQFKDTLNNIAVGGYIEIKDLEGNFVRVYKDQGGVGAWTNPIPFDSLGHPNVAIWLPWDKSYDMCFYEADGTLIECYE